MHTLLAHHLLSPRIHVKSLLRKKKKEGSSLPLFYPVYPVKRGISSRSDYPLNETQTFLVGISFFLFSPFFFFSPSRSFHREKYFQLFPIFATRKIKSTKNNFRIRSKTKRYDGIMESGWLEKGRKKRDREKERGRERERYILYRR